MGQLVIQEKQIVIPGEEIATGMDFLPSSGTFRDGEGIYSNKLGVVEVQNRVIKVIPLAGVYMPNRGDLVIGMITDIGFSGWTVDIGAPAPANLPVGEAVRERVELLKAEISRYFDVEDILITKVMNVTKSRIVQLSMRDYGLRKIRGRLLKLSPSKVPRLIGKKGSMVSMIKEYTRCEINVGQNGYICVSGPVEGQVLVENAINLIEAKAHTSGLTDKVKELLESSGAKPVKQASPVVNVPSVEEGVNDE